ncbi:Protein srek1IP1 [Geranomyces variabilis]|nr:Protein srek1IP1 [Geranomyces variabilis]
MASRNLVRAVGISALATEHILHTLFSFLGTVRELKLSQSPTEPGVQNALIEFEDPAAAVAALHLTGTQLGDRALFVTISTQLPQQPPSLVIPAATGSGGLAHTAPLSATSPSGTPLFRNPNLTATILHHDPQKADEISRTIYIGNIPHEASEADLRATFAACGDIIAVKIAGDAHQTSRFAFMEFATEEAAGKAMLLNGVVVRDRAVKVNFSKNTIAKTPRVDSADPAMRRVAEAQAAIRRKYTGGGDDMGDSPTTTPSAPDMRGPPAPPPPPPPPPPRRATSKEPSSQIDRHISVIERDGTTRRISRSPSPSHSSSRRRASSPPRHRRSSDHHRRRPRSRSRSRSPVRLSRRSATSAVTSSSRRSSRSRSRSRSPSYRSSGGNRYRSSHRSRHRSRRRSRTRSRTRSRSVSSSRGGGGGGGGGSPPPPPPSSSSSSRKKAKVVIVNREEGSRTTREKDAPPVSPGGGVVDGNDAAPSTTDGLKRSKDDGTDGDGAPSTPVKAGKRRRSPSPLTSPPGVIKKEK